MHPGAGTGVIAEMGTQLPGCNLVTKSKGALNLVWHWGSDCCPLSLSGTWVCYRVLYLLGTGFCLIPLYYPTLYLTEVFLLPLILQFAPSPSLQSSAPALYCPVSGCPSARCPPPVQSDTSLQPELVQHFAPVSLTSPCTFHLLLFLLCSPPACLLLLPPSPSVSLVVVVLSLFLSSLSLFYM